MAYVMKTKSTSKGTKVPLKAKIGLSILHCDISAGDVGELVRQAKTDVGDAPLTEGHPLQCISRIPAVVLAALERKDPDVLRIYKEFGVDLTLDNDEQNWDAVEVKIRNYLTTLKTK